MKEDKLDLEEKRRKGKFTKNTEKLNYQFVDQKGLVDMNKSKTNKILSETKNKDTNYKNLLADRVAKQKALRMK